MAWEPESQSDYDLLYDRMFGVYGKDPSSLGIGVGTTQNFIDNMATDLAGQMGGTGDWQSWYTGGDWGGSFDDKDYFKGILGAYFSGTDDPADETNFTSQQFGTYYDTSMSSAFMSDVQGGPDDLGYWTGSEYGQESLGRMQYGMAKESALEKALGTSQKYQHGVGKAGFAGGSKGGVIGESSMWDDYKQAAEAASGQFSSSQRSARESWLDALLSSAEVYMGEL